MHERHGKCNTRLYRIWNRMRDEIDGITDTLTGWSKRTGISKLTIKSRYHRYGMRGAELIQPLKDKR